MLLTQGSHIDQGFWSLVFGDELLAALGFIDAVRNGDLFGATEIFLGWASSEQGRDNLIHYATQRGLGWTSKHITKLCAVIELALAAKTILSYGWDTFFAPMEDRVILTAIPRYDVSWDGLGPTTVNVNQTTGIAIRVYNNGNTTLRKVWLGLDIYDPTGLKVENTKTPMPDTGQGGTGRIGWLNFGDSLTGQGVDIPPSGYYIFGLKTPYTFRNSVTGHAYRGGTYQYHYFIWQNGYPGQPGAKPLNDDIAITDLKIIGANSPQIPAQPHIKAGNGRVTLGWIYNSPNIEWDLKKFRIYRSTGLSTNFVLHDSVPTPVCAYVDTFVTNGNTYYYRIGAVNKSEVEGALTPILQATPHVIAPSTPGQLTATPGDAVIRLSWTASQPGGNPIRLYYIYRGTSSGGQGSNPFDSVFSPVTSYNDNRVTNGTTYYYYVRAVDNASPPNISEKSNEANARPQSGIVPPSTPTGLIVTSGDRQVTLNWNPNPSGTHRYRIYRSLSGGGNYTLIDSVYHPTATYTNIGLTNNTTYYFKLSAVNSAGQASALCGQVSATPRPPNSSPGLSNASISPASPKDGEYAAVYVTYQDSDGQSPAWVRGYNDAGGSTVMTTIGPFPENWRTGVNFCGGLSFNNPGTHGYYFMASDGITTIRYPSSGYISVTIQPRPPEQPLQLDSAKVSPKIISPRVSPDTTDKCTLYYKLNNSATVKVEVVRDSATTVRTLVNWGGRQSGTMQGEIWDGKDDGGNFVPDGSYFFKIQGSNFDELIATLAQGQIDANYGDIAVDTIRNRIYIVEMFNHRVRVFDRNGNWIRDFGQEGFEGPPGYFYLPNGIAVDNSGNIYVADFWNRRVQKFNSNFQFVAWLILSPPGLMERAPVDIAIDEHGNLYIALKRLGASHDSILKYRSNFSFVRGEHLGQLDHYYGQVAVGKSYVAVCPIAAGQYQVNVYDTNLVRIRDITISSQPEAVAIDGNGHLITVHTQTAQAAGYKFNPQTGDLLVRNNSGYHVSWTGCYGLAIDAQNSFIRLAEERLFRCKNGWAQAIGRVNPIDPLQVQVDNSPPFTNLDYPHSGDSLSDVVSTLGTANDRNFKQYVLEYGDGIAPLSWGIIRSDTISVDSGLLGEWNTNNLPNGIYRLRLRTFDDAYNIDSAIAVVNVNHDPPGVSLDTTYPLVFSPNGDGIKDTVTIGYTLAKSALVTITVLDANNAVVRTLASGVPEPMGANFGKWDGKNNAGSFVGDGQYRILLVASDSVNNQSPAETAVVSVDCTRPTVLIREPTNSSLLSGLISFIGTATDANPLCREMYYFNNNRPDSSIKWDSSGSIEISGLLAMLNTANLRDTVYTFKLKMQDQAGNKDSTMVWATIDNSLPDPPVLISPPDTSAFRNRSPQFIWGRTMFTGERPIDPDSVTYTFQLGKDFRFITYDTTVVLRQDTFWQYPRSLLDTIYYWHVKATDAAGNEGYYQNYPFEFTVDNIAPGTPILLLPADSAIITQDTIVRFCWHKSVENGSGIRHYVLRLSDSPNFIPYIDTLVRDTACELQLPDSLYYWKVKAIDRAQNESDWSVIRMFIKDLQAPQIPTLLAPANQSTVSDSTPRFIWTKVTYKEKWAGDRFTKIIRHSLSEDGSPVCYTLECALDDSFRVGLISIQGIPDTSYDLPDSLALNDTAYFWRVEAVDLAGHHSGFTNPWSFRVKAYFDISGYAKYYSNPNAVESVNVVLGEFRSDTALTNSSGYYILSGVPVLQNYIVNPFKVNSQWSGAVSSYDAAMVLQHAVRMDTLDSLQFIAGDVSGDSFISSFDAALILRYAIRMIRHFPVGARPGSDTVDWAFRPKQRTYTQPTQNQVNQNYKSILYGDPSGNWSGNFIMPASSKKEPINFFFVNFPKEKDAEIFQSLFSTKVIEDEGMTVLSRDSSFSLRITKEKDVLQEQKEDVTALKDEIPSRLIIYPVEVKNAKGVISADLQISYNPKYLRPVEIRTSEISNNFLAAGADYGGILRIAMAGWQKLNGDVKLLEVIFEEKSEALANPEIEIDWVVLNEGEEELIESAVMGKTEPLKISSAISKPNPFANKICIQYSVPKETRVDIKVYNSLGQTVKTLVNEVKKPGDYFVFWDGRDEKGDKQPNGIYFVRTNADKKRVDKKIVLLQK